MTENQFDELFRNKLKDYSSQVPDNMWERIHPKKDRDRKLFFIWLKFVIVPVFTLAGLAGGFYIGARPAADHFLYHTQVASTNGEISISNAPITYAGSPHRALADHIPALSDPTASPVYNATTAHPQIFSGSPASPSYSQARPVPPARPRIYPSHPSAHSAATSADPEPVPSTGIPPSLANADDSFKQLPLPGIQPITNNPGHPAIGQAPKTTSIAIKRSGALPPAPKNNILSPLKKGSWSVDLYASPDLPVLRFKQDFEKARLSFTIGLKVNRSFGDHLSAATGMQYSQINEKITYHDSGATSPIRYSYLKRTSFDFPLLIGYGIGSDHFRATLNAGMIFKIHSSGNLYTTSNSIYLGVDLAKKINDKISLFAEPYYRYSLPGGSNSQYYIQRINQTGLSIGLRYNFKKSGRHKQYDTNN